MPESNESNLKAVKASIEYSIVEIGHTIEEKTFDGFTLPEALDTKRLLYGMQGLLSNDPEFTLCKIDIQFDLSYKGDDEKKYKFLDFKCHTIFKVSNLKQLYEGVNDEIPNEPFFRHLGMLSSAHARGIFAVISEGKLYSKIMIPLKDVFESKNSERLK